MLMVLTACLVILSMTGGVADLDAVLAPNQVSTTTADRDSRVLIVAALHRAAQEEQGEFVGPPAPTAEQAAANMTLGASAPTSPAGADDEFVGPPAPAAVLAREFEGPPEPSERIVLATPVQLASAAGVGGPAGLGAELDAQGASGAAEELKDDSSDAVREFLEATEPAATDGTRAFKHRFQSGETMSQVLGKVGVSQTQADEWIRATNDEYDLDRVYAGQELELLLVLPSSELQQLRMEIDPQTILVVERQEGRLVARREEISYDRTLRAVGGQIEHSLYETAQAYGIPEKVISDMAEILGWDIDLSSDLEPSATFRVVYEELTRPDTMETIPGRLLAVDLHNHNERHEGFYFSMPDGQGAGYYDRTGEGIGRGFLRFPVAFTRVTSNFSTARFHPILKRPIPHYGVDFAAPPGTPVEAVADGRVLTAGWYGGNGRFVKIAHDAVYETSYSHLSRISPLIHQGGWVKKGQIVGYVGATGLATGPHLHFAMYRNGQYIDPMKANLPRARSLGGRELAAFRMRVDMMDRAYANAGKPGDPTQVAVAPSSSAGGGE